MVFWKRKKKTANLASTTSVPATTSITGPGNPHLSLIKRFEAEMESRTAQFYNQDAIKNRDSYKAILDLSPKDRAGFLTQYAKTPPFVRNLKLERKRNEHWTYKRFAAETFGPLIRRKADFTPEQILEILTALKDGKGAHFTYWPLGLIINQLEKSLKTHPLTEATQKALSSAATWKEFDRDTYYGSDPKKARLKLITLVAGVDDSLATYPTGTQNIGRWIQADLDAMDESSRQSWYALFTLAATATGGKPTKKFTTAITPAIDAMGAEAFKSQVREWILAAAKADSFDDPATRTHYNHGRIGSNMQNLFKGLVWSMSRFHDDKSLSAIAALADRCFQRLPGIGPAAPAVGNACIYTLANSKGLSGVAHLSRLKLRIKQNNTQKLIQKSIEAQAAKQGLKSAEIEDMAAPDFGLKQGTKEIEFKDYTLHLDATETGQATLSWRKPDGSAQKSVPSFIKDSAPLKRKLADIRAQAKDIKKASTAQRDRIDRLYTEDMSWEPDAFHKYYLDHGLIGPMARKLIWQLTIGGKPQPGLYRDGEWEDQTGNAIKGRPEKFQLWHPIMSESDVVLAWRARLEALKIKQPFKQSYREVYILTDAEINTKVYSNRMAAHILKQHQFNALSAIRGWKYSLLAVHDDGRDNEIAQKALPAYGLTAEFWIDALYDMTDSYNDAGMWDYVATDQIRFNNTENSTHVDLVDVPPIILSEILRDTDLFVGVASVGNDPAWADRGGAPRTNQYWQSYSFGDLSETAKTRKAVLENLLPRLKIRDKAHIDGKFLVVKGTRASYKIHMGSSNILIMPNDQYLCIVPGRGKDKKVENIFLPFEGDRGLSIVLSKAFMLAEDDKITDKTILSQLSRKTS